MFGQLVLQHGFWQPLVGNSLSFCKLVGVSGETLFVDYYYCTKLHLRVINTWNQVTFTVTFLCLPIYVATGPLFRDLPLRYCMILLQCWWINLSIFICLRLILKSTEKIDRFFFCWRRVASTCFQCFDGFVHGSHLLNLYTFTFSMVSVLTTKTTRMIGYGNVERLGKGGDNR